MNTVGEELVVGLSGNPAIESQLVAMLTLLVSAVIVTASTALSVPMSMSQTAVGAVIGSGIALSVIQPGSGIWVNSELLIAVFISWGLNPFVSGSLAFFANRSTGLFTRKVRTITGITKLIFVGLLLTSAFTAYSFGANDLGASTGLSYAFFLNQGFPDAVLVAGFLGWAGAVAGAIMLGKRVMSTVESGITRLDPFTAFSAQLGTAIAVWIFVQFHLPVSTTQAFVGGLIGAGLAKGMAAVDSKNLGKIVKTWILAPSLAFLISLAINLAVFL